ncbi:PXMP2/4 family protein 4 [Vitis vinifera]|uniref:PXMP2/4 family protein 4 n=1 Tax=Vitis vinifera TaxID=29760 RepID=A0A438HN38_VITVI|nr:PXMP2/4 family protein 4 [Vitis vinifera]
MGSLLGGAGGGHGGLWWRPFESQKRQGRRRRSSKPSDSVDRTTSGGGYRFPLKQALTAGSLAFAGDSIAQLSERYRKRNSLSDSDSDSGFSKLLDSPWGSNLGVHSTPNLGVHSTPNLGVSPLDSPWEHKPQDALIMCATSSTGAYADLSSEIGEGALGAITQEWATLVRQGIDSLRHPSQCIHDIMRMLCSNHDWLRALRMASYGFLLYGPGSYAWYQYLDHALPKQTVENLLLKVLLNQIVLGPSVVAIVFAWNNIWQGKLSELPNKYQKDAIPTLITGYKFWIPVSALNFW